MKKNYFFKFLLLAIPVSAFILLSFSAGNPNSLSGSPGDSGANCTQCHTGTASKSNITITTNIPTTGYEFNTDYTVTLTNTDGGSRNGFQVTAERDANNSKIGTFISTSSDTQTAADNSRIIHTSNGNSQSSWTFKWKSPSTEQGRITFYGSSVSGNGIGGNSGDKVYLGSSVSTPSLTISDAKRLNFDMFPNPAAENLNIQLPSGVEKASVEFYDYVGRLALSKKVSNLDSKIDVNSLSKGVYLLKVITDSKIGSQTFIKN